MTALQPVASNATAGARTASAVEGSDAAPPQEGRGFLPQEVGNGPGLSRAAPASREHYRQAALDIEIEARQLRNQSNADLTRMLATRVAHQPALALLQQNLHEREALVERREAHLREAEVLVRRNEELLDRQQQQAVALLLRLEADAVTLAESVERVDQAEHDILDLKGQLQNVLNAAIHEEHALHGAVLTARLDQQDLRQAQAALHAEREALAENRVETEMSKAEYERKLTALQQRESKPRSPNKWNVRFGR
ncbi:hypothetical protein WG628_21070 [Stenotrophomonas maltophilia]